MANFRSYSNGYITISGGNAKLGHIPNFSLPPGKSCPGRTEACKRCYVAKSYRIYPPVPKAYEKNTRMAENIGFVYRMNRYFKAYRPSFFRIHVSGDFFSVRYTQTWIKLIKDNPDTTFFGFTRSWRIPELLPHLEQLRSLPNMVLWASWDQYSKDTPDGWRVASMGQPSDKRYAVECAAYTHDLKCDACGLCYSKGSKNQSIYFPIH